MWSEGRMIRSIVKSLNNTNSLKNNISLIKKDYSEFKGDVELQDDITLLLCKWNNHES